MAQQPAPTIENHFQAGLKTEFTGLNFPEHAATDAQNCVFTLTGDVNRRGGINYETNFISGQINNSNPAIARSSFRWLNAGGDGQTQILVLQIGTILWFYVSSNATAAQPLSTTILSNSAIDISSFQALGSTANISLTECQFASGNGYLFVFHPNCDPFYCIYNNGVINPNRIDIQIRDLGGILENIPVTFRPNTLTNEHLYNLINQGWTQGSGWSGNGSSDGNQNIPSIGQSFTIPITSQTNTNVLVPGDLIKINVPNAAGTGSNPHSNGTVNLTGSVTSYSTPFNQVVVTITAVDNTQLNAFGAWSGGNFFFIQNQTLALTLINEGFINTWNSALKNFPSNSDVWWLYKDTTQTFNPSATFANTQQGTGPAPKGAFILSAFNQNRTAISSIGGLTNVSTTVRPSTGAFFAGRVFYAGVNASQQATGDEPYTTWTENIYFSQIIVNQTDFGLCYQDNDPTSQNLNALLPSDGGVITIQGTGAIYKLFALRYGLLIFAANGIWFISGSSGIGFTANDFVITKISSIKAISGTSFVDVQGYPMFWNQEGIYQVTPTQQAGSAHSPDIQLDVRNICLGTILAYYDTIPLTSKSISRGDYDPINYIVQWCYKSVNATGLGTGRYGNDTILCYNVVTQAFYPYTLSSTASVINDIKYIDYPGGSATVPGFKYVTSVGNTLFLTFSEENDFTRYLDFVSENGGYNYTSYFVTGYSLTGQGLRKIQTPYVYMFSRNPGLNAYGIRAIWDYAGSPILGQTDALSGKWSTRQVITNNQTDYTMIYRKIRLRGRGLAVQIRVDSQPGQPFDIMGWSVWNEVNAGI